ncbi:MAG: acyloxyacyl hydrolase [Phycisphaerales bacterium]|jgi:hypothetical protein|nr:acyloxyacyl hydrolase [Phycisphaerales bacterium]
MISTLLVCLVASVDAHPAPARVDLNVQPPAETAPAPSATLESRPAMVRFGTEGTRWWTIGAGAGKDLHDALDVNVHAAFSTFIAQDWEWAIEGALWNIALDGNDAQAINATMIFRWHFHNAEKWSAYVDGGIGLLFSTDDVPNDGTSLNFTPRVGLGVTRQITDAGTRLQAGVRWHHISNARITGDDNNPSRDGLMLYAGVMIPF